MSQDVDLSPRARTLVIWMVALVLVPVLGGLGWVALQLIRPAEPCPLCDAVATGEVVQVQAALDRGASVTSVAWHDALEAARATTETGSPSLAIVALLLDHGADPNDFWTPSGSYSAASPTTASLRLGSTTFASGGASLPSRRRVFAAEVAALRSPDTALIERFLTRGLDVQGKGAGEALVSAARARHLAIVQRLLDAGVPANYVATELPRRTALAEAIQTLDLPLIAALEARGAREWP